MGRVSGRGLASLLPALARVDALLRALAEGRPRPGGTTLARADGDPPSPLDDLGVAFRLDDFELDVLLLALAPELDPAYAVYFASLQDDPRATHPTVETVLSLLIASSTERLERRRQLGPAGTLVRDELVRPGTALEVDPQIVRFVSGDEGLDPRLDAVARLVRPRSAIPAAPALSSFLAEAGDEAAVLLLGARDAGGLERAEALAHDRGTPLLVLHAAAAAERGDDLEHAARAAVREAALCGALLCVADLDGLERPALRALAAGLRRRRAPLVVVGADRHLEDLTGLELDVVPLASPSPADRRSAWARALGDDAAAIDLDTLASRFRLGPDAIARAVEDGRARARLRAAAGGPPGLGAADLLAGARARSGHELARLARRLEPVFSWDDIVLPADSVTQLREICDRVVHRDRVVDDWGFRRSLGIGHGISALFAGSSGTGKTMAAGIVANELGLDLYAIDLASIVSKYIGETSKNLDRIFRAAEDANAVLFFDEADALFGKRSEVRDSHDRYANVEIAYLLQKMEVHEGVAILATNLRQNLDEAFARRLGFTVHFPFPNTADRREIWDRVWPDEVPLGADVDLDDLAERFRLSGGNIRNAALAAAFLAAADGTAVRREHLLRAVRREYQKLGRGLSDEELGGLEPELAETTA